MGCDLDHGVGCNCGGSTAIADRAEGPAKSSAETFVEFVLRHTWPERAKAHGYVTVHELILHHPFVKMFAPKHTVFHTMPTETAAGLLREAASKFRFYQSQHEQKYRDIEAEIAKLDEGDDHMPLRRRLADTHEKARVNAEIATRIERYLESA